MRANITENGKFINAEIEGEVMDSHIFKINRNLTV